MSDNENEEGDEKWWSSFCSQETKKDEETPFSSQASNVSTQTISSQPINIATQTSADKDDNEKDDGSDNDEENAEFYVKFGKHEKFK